MNKTNAMRLLDKAKISYRTVEYEVDENNLCGTHIAEESGIPLEMCFKTIVLKGERKGFCVFCLPVNKEINLKKAAHVIGDKKIELLPVKDLQKITGYIRGGCSPVGMKKKFPTYIEHSAVKFEEISVSAGVRGLQMILSPQELISYVDAELVDVAE